MRGKQTGKGRESKENQGIDGGQGRLAEITEWRGFQNNEAGLTHIPTPGNSGAADLSFYVLFSTGLTTAGLAFPAMVVWRILSFYSLIIIGFIFTTVYKKHHKKPEFAELNEDSDPQ